MADDTLPIFESLGFKLEEPKRRQKQSRNVCPFCNGDKFYVNPETTLWDCKNCLLKGNAIEFMRRCMRCPQREGAGTFANWQDREHFWRWTLSKRGELRGAS